jgi:hypothetical protein
MQVSSSTYVIGDVHGQLKTLVKLLQQAEIIDHHSKWRAGAASLWFIGDLVDRGHDSIGVLDLVMRLQLEAEAVGGKVACLLGNHELMMLAAYRFGRRSTGLGSSFIARWKMNGGNRKDLASLTPQHLNWLAQLPALARVESYVLAHADAPLYIKYGRSIEEVNSAFQNIMKRSNALAWEELLDDFSGRGVFLHELGGEEFLQRFLQFYGGQYVIHGHTPISSLLRCSPRKVSAAYIYANARCINVDGGMFLGGPGFIYQIPVA